MSVLLVDAMAPSAGERLRTPEKLAYAAGEMAAALSWNLAGGFLLFYYTDVALLPVTALGFLMLATRVLDAVFDPLAGICVDRTRSLYGKARPYLLYVPVPFAILTVMTFSVPDVGPVLKMAYAFVTFTLMGLAYSFLYVPYGALLPLIARDPLDRIQLGSFRSMATSVASIIVFGLAMPIVSSADGGRQQAGFTVAATVFGCATAILFFITFVVCRERYGQVEAIPSGTGLVRGIREAWANALWRKTFIIGLLVTVRLGFMISTAAYYAKVILNRTDVLSIMLPSVSVAIFVGGFLAGLVLRKADARVVNSLGGLLSIISYLAMSQVTSNVPLFLGLFALSNVSIGLHATTLFVMFAKSVDDHERLFGTRAEGLLVAGSSFAQKVGMAVGIGLVAFGLAAAGYDPANITQAAQRMIRACFYLGPIVITLSIVAGFWFWLDKEDTAR